MWASGLARISSTKSQSAEGDGFAVVDVTVLGVGESPEVVARLFVEQDEQGCRAAAGDVVGGDVE